MQLLKQSTASTLLVGPVLDSTGTAVTTAVIGDFNITKNGTTAALAAAATATHSHNGHYLLALTTGNTDTLGRLTISGNNSAQAMSTHRYSILTATTFDAIITNAATAAGGLLDIQRIVGIAPTLGASLTFPTSVASPTNITAATGITLTPTSGLGNQTANITGNLSGSVGSVTGNVGGNVTGSVGSVLGGINTTGGVITTLDALDTAQDAQHAISQAALDNLSTSSAGISTVASSFTKTTGGTETNTYTSTQQVNLVYHIVPPSAGNTDIYYQFDIGSDGVPVQVEWVGYVQSTGDSYGVYFYNWAGTSWDQVATMAGSNSTSPRTENWIATTAHVGTGANDGLVRLRFLSTDGTNVATDRILCTYAVIANSGVVTSGVAQSGTATSITLATAASATNGTYDPGIVRIVSGTGSGQARLILDYVGSTRVATIDRNWRTNPDSTSFYEVVSAPNLVSRNEGIAAGGASGSITLNSSASAVNDTYVGQTVWIVAGTGQDQTRIVTAYNGTTKVATVSSAWTTTPDTSSVYLMLPQGRAEVIGFTTAAKAEINAEADTAITDAAISSQVASDLAAAHGAGSWATATGFATPTNITAATGVTLTATTGLGNQTANITGNLSGSVGSIATGGIVAASFASGAINAAAIATDAIDADALAADAVTEIWAKAMTELTSVPGVSATVLQALTWVFELSRNKITQTSTTQLVKKDDGTTTLGTSTVSDDGTTFTRGGFS